MTYQPWKEDRENGPWISQTQPDESRTIKEIFGMYAKNEPLGGRLTSTMDSYSDSPQDKVSLDDPDLMELARMDLTDRAEYLEQLKSNIENQKERIKAAQDALQRKQAIQASVNADFQAFQEEQDQKQRETKEAGKGPQKPSTEAKAKQAKTKTDEV